MPKRHRVFIFDDDEIVRMLLVDICESAGWETYAYESPAASPMYQAGEVRWDNRDDCVDVVIADVRMPDVNGVDFLWSTQVKQLDIDHCAVVSGYWTASMEEQARAIGFTIFHKPFQVQDIRRWLDGCRVDVDPTSDSQRARAQAER
ncbi:MAG: response regulator [Planctomycetota bacterium]